MIGIVNEETSCESGGSYVDSYIAGLLALDGSANTLQV